VKAWIAVGNIAYGAIFACGNVAIAPVSVGLFGLGIISIGGSVLGALAVGMYSAGIAAVGGIALGWMASGAGAFGLNAAYGLESYARNFAFSPPGHTRWAAYAIHVNDSAARDFFAQSRFFSWTSSLFNDHRLLYGALSVALFFSACAWLIARIRQGQSLKRE
jgi:hypothetical protein